MKAALYLRVSTDKQELENQLEPLKKFAKGRGLKIVATNRFLDAGYFEKVFKHYWRVWLTTG